ncbi:1-phosphofructokinase [Paenibacillus phyllosphaerae]|uniref:Tagatose-6-phosphate kinase n=1 Tax=Paenibacillus phyllosphaerae TaxID=274593 RepID=A0A7W5ASW4_9BACL|nr:1-phosphofructokinase [Paenibacillus phyllosphaerae]MBB3108185.1 1-phosphofructokinase [Paenibacillus phyllosphaerae]
MKRIMTVTLNPAIDKTVTVDQLTVAGLNRIKEIRVDPGGKGINVAKVLLQFGSPVNAWGFQAGMEGQLLMQMLEEIGIPSSFFQTPGKSRTNLKVVDETTKQTTELNEMGQQPSDQAIREFLEAFEAEMKRTSILVLGGSLPPGLPQDFYRTLTEIAGKNGVRTLLDADGDALAAGIEAGPYAIKPNLHELQLLVGQQLTSDEAIVTAARKLLAGGTEYVAVSMGAEGALIVHREGTFRTRPFPITPISTVGAGDSMVAAMAHCMNEEMPIEEMVRWMTAAGSITASKPGTDVCTLDEVLRKLSEVEVTRV